uniref:Phosphoribosyltransferase domain-containing protein n=1 Tax=Globisporangium ultimum (strain ATCC 200006 / CBS 805.95 / DAOM BR144) TaxID=431595 RepID=K3WV07_GLOUD
MNSNSTGRAPSNPHHHTPPQRRLPVFPYQRPLQQQHLRTFPPRSHSAPDGDLSARGIDNSELHQHNHHSHSLNDIDDLDHELAYPLSALTTPSTIRSSRHTDHTPPASSRESLLAFLQDRGSPEFELGKEFVRGSSSRKNSDEEISSRTSSVGTANSVSQQQLDHIMEDTSYSQNGRAQQQQQLRKSSNRTQAVVNVAGGAAGKRSRYLREVDRRSIIHRIDRGEKQAALAKEFGVTRAAICHINKNRIEILTRSTRADVHSAARHPKRGLYTTSVAPPSVIQALAAREQAEADAASDAQPIVHEMKSRSMAVLMTTLRKRETQPRDFQICTDRAFRLLLEEALSRVPMHAVDIVTPYDFVCEGVAMDRPSCGISISEDGFALLQIFRDVQPASPVGFITLNATAMVDGQSAEPTLQKVCAPPDLRIYNVVLMEATCATGAGACVSIQALLDFGALESSIHFVCLLASAFAVTEICNRFPQVRIVTGGIDPDVSEGDAICPGIGNFTERYFNTTVTHHTSMGANVDL